MDPLEPSTLHVVGGFLVLAGLFVLPEIVSGVLKEARKELWRWAKSRRSTRRRHIGNGPDYG